MTRLSALVLLAAIACAPPKEEKFDTTTLAAVDTLKPDTMARRDSIAGASTMAAAKTATKTGSKTSPAGTKTATGTKARRDSIIGRDKAIQFDPTKKQLDTVKTKRPPR